MNLNIQKYEEWDLSNKLCFFDDDALQLLIKEWKGTEISSFLKFFILNPNENRYIVKKALSLFVDLVLSGVISNRQVLNLLIDEIDHIEGTFVQIERFKSLLLFYELEPHSVLDIFLKNQNNDDIEVKSESLYSLGLVYFLDANKEINQENFQSKIDYSISYFRASYLCTENRIDSLFFLLISEVIQLGKFTPSFQSENHLQRITQLLWQYRLFSFDDKLLCLKVKIYRIIHNLLHINKQNPSEWLQYKDEFHDLCLAFYELKNSEIKGRFTKSSLIKALKEGLIATNLEPFFRINFNALKIKIERYLALPEIVEIEKEVLNHILSLIDDNNLTLSDNILSTRTSLEKAFPNASKSRIKELLDVDSIESLQCATLKVFEELGRFSFEELYDNLLASLILLQGNISYKNKTENERNTYIGSMLLMAGFGLKDQALWGSSNTGKAAGEVDLMILDNMQLPFSIIEALILDSLKQDYLKLHIDKIYKYDTTGLSNNIILVYSESKNFLEFTKRYFSYISTYEYPYKQLSSESIDSGYSEIKIQKITLDRNGKETNLYHLIVNIAN